MNIRNHRRLLVCAGMAACLFLEGCTAGGIIDHFSGKDNTMEDSPPPKTASRVYMDEVSGTLAYFDANTLSIKSEDLFYDFDIYNATIECTGGLLYGDEISVIYEGQMAGNDTTSVRALKVTDAFHKKEKLKQYNIQGVIQAFTPNLLTLTTSKQKTLTCSIIGRQVSFSDGLAVGKRVYMRALGNPHEISENTLDGTLLTILAVSDQRTYQLPDPPALPDPKAAQAASPETAAPDTTLQKMRASIESISGQQMTVKPWGGDVLLTLDLSVTPLYAQGGILPGSLVDVYYYGQYNGENMGGITVEQIRGLSAAAAKPSDMTGYIQGTVVSTTANTVSIQTPDGILFTGNTQNIQNTSTGGLEPGSGVRITVDPYQSSRTNIYKLIKIEDG